MKNTILFAHRGYSSIAPENTMPAFTEAIKAGFGGVECDVWETRENGLMIMHDESLLRMCGVNKLITSLTPDQLAAYPVIRGTNIAKYGGRLPIPSYEQYLDLFAYNTTVPLVEIKSRNAMSEAAVTKILKLIHDRGMGNRTIIQSFNMASLLRVLDVKNKRYPSMRLTTLYLTAAPHEISRKDMKKYREAGISGVCMKNLIAISAVIAGAQAYGLKVGVWVVDDKTLADKLARVYKVNYIISNKKLFK